jgi:uncharacterized phiE125 gp8 family phage protein
MIPSYKTYADVTTEPITLVQAKDYLNIEAACTTFDTLITALIPAARQKIEAVTNYKLGVATIDVIFERVVGELFLEIGNIATIDSVKYYDGANELQTWAASKYEADMNTAPVLFRPAYNITYPTLYRRYDAFTVRVTTNTLYPKPLLQAMYLTLGHWFENRQNVVVGHSANEVPQTAGYICDIYALKTLR